MPVSCIQQRFIRLAALNDRQILPPQKICCDRNADGALVVDGHDRCGNIRPACQLCRRCAVVSSQNFKFIRSCDRANQNPLIKTIFFQLLRKRFQLGAGIGMKSNVRRKKRTQLVNRHIAKLGFCPLHRHLKDAFIRRVASLLLGCLLMMFKTNWIMTISAIVASLIGFVLMVLIMGRSQRYFIARQQGLGDMNGHIEEAYAGHTVIRVSNAEKEFSEKFEELNEKLYQASWKSQFLSGLMMPIMGFIGNLGYVTVCVIGALLTMNGSITFGVIIAFMVYVRLFTNPLSQIAQAMTNIQSAAAASGRVFDFLEAEELEDESSKTAKLSNPTGQVTFEHVKFGYTPDRIIIHDFSQQVQPGQKVAIVGPTGAGKTTLVNLLMRFYEIDGGSISIDGINTRQITRENVHSLFGMVLQDTWLFEGTIRDNIVYGKQGVTNEDLDRVCKAVGLYHYIHTLPNGYDTVLDSGISLSEGQKQLMTIARAMIENAPMLILDEATSSVDTRTELLIQQAMDQLTKGRTSFVIAHRLSTIKNADIILVLKDGDIIESGNHQTLLEKGGFYAELYNAQFAR